MLTSQSPHPTPDKPPFFLWRPLIVAWRWLVPQTLADRDRQSPLARRVRFFVILLLALGLPTFAIINARPFYRAAQDWRSTRKAAAARALADQGEVFQAVMLAQEAYRLSPENLNAIRLNAEFFTLIKREEAIYFWEKLAKTNSTNEADEVLHIRALVNANRAKEAQQKLETRLAENPADDQVLKLAQDLFGKQDYVANLLPQLEGYAKLHPDDRQNLLRLAQLQIDSGLNAEVNKGLATLWELVERDDSTSLQALEALNNRSDLPTTDAQRLIRRLREHPRSNTAHKVAAFRWEVKLAPHQRNEIITEAVRQLGHTKREELHPLVRWLVEERQPQQVLSLVTEETAVAYQPILENYLTSLTMLNRHADLERLVNDRRVEAILTRATSAFYRLHLGFVTGKPLADLRRMMQTATLNADSEGRSELLVAIGKYGEERTMPDLAEVAYESALKSRRTYVAGLEGLLRATRLSGNTAAHIKALTDAIRRWPDNQTYQEQWLYAQMLKGAQLELCQQQAEQLLQLRPNDPVVRLLNAMAWWRFRNFDSAARHVQGLNAANLSSGQQAVLAAVNRSVGFSQIARTVTDVIPADAVMFPEERQLFLAARR